MNYVPHTDDDVAEMLAVIGKGSIDELYNGLEPFFADELPMPDGKSQQQVERLLFELAGRGKTYNSIFRGAGAYNRYIPAAVKSLTGRQEFLTAYTPYQAELSQGILQGIFEYQSMICRLTGMDVSNASVYDGSTALADGILMLAERKKNKVLLSRGINPMALEVVRTYLRPQGIEIEYIDLDETGRTSLSQLESKLTDGVFAVAVAQPNYNGIIEPTKEIGEAVSGRSGYCIYAEPVSMALLAPPGECRADIAVGEGQPLGMPLSFGGPYLGFIAASQKYMRRLVGRVVGKTTDAQGKDAYVLTLQAREQHIRREKASSSICSNQALCALTATVYMAAMGKSGLIEVAKQSLSKAHYLAKRLTESGVFRLKYSAEFFNEFVTVSALSSDKIIKRCADKGILAGLKLSDSEMLWCATEMNTKDDIDGLIAALEEAGG